MYSLKRFSSIANVKDENTHCYQFTALHHVTTMSPIIPVRFVCWLT